MERVLKEAARYAEDARQLNAQAGNGKLGLGIQTSSTGIPSVYDPNMGLYGTISTHFSGAYIQALARGSLRVKDEYLSLANWMAKQLPVSGTNAVTGAAGISLGVYAGVKAVKGQGFGNQSNKAGWDYEKRLSYQFGNQGAFRVGGREFDGANGDEWYEAKAGGYWQNVDPEQTKNQLGAQAAIARRNGKEFIVYSDSPISDDMKAWMKKRV